MTGNQDLEPHEKGSAELTKASDTISFIKQPGILRLPLNFQQAGAAIPSPMPMCYLRERHSESSAFLPSAKLKCQHGAPAHVCTTDFCQHSFVSQQCGEVCSLSDVPVLAEPPLID